MKIITEILGNIIVAIITGALSIVGVIIANSLNNKKMQFELEKRQAVTEAKIDNLAHEVRRHNNFAERIPAIEEKLNSQNFKIEQLERNEMNGKN